MLYGLLWSQKNRIDNSLVVWRISDKSMCEASCEYRKRPMVQRMHTSPEGAVKACFWNTERTSKSNNLLSFAKL